MPRFFDFVKIGVFPKKKLGSRGWRIWTEGKVVQWEFGRVETSKNSRSVRFHWAVRPTTDGPQELSTGKHAAIDMEQRKSEKRRAKYELLPDGKGILGEKSGALRRLPCS
jgi:hypothetical protein